MRKHSKLKYYSILFLESPLIVVVFVLRLVVAILTFCYIRVIKKGILMGSQFEKDLEFHEQGKRK
jgi:hypothetical protein